MEKLVEQRRPDLKLNPLPYRGIPVHGRNKHVASSAWKPRVKHRPEIDGLRALAVVPVVLFHAQVPGFQGGFLGVDIFFVISGYLITGILSAEREADGISLARFYERRVRRIAPALLTASLFIALWSFLAVSPVRVVEISKTLLATLVGAANYWLLNHATYFATPSSENPLIHFWSLSVEEQFYLCLPLFMVLTRRLAQQWLLFSFLGLALLP